MKSKGLYLLLFSVLVLHSVAAHSDDKFPIIGAQVFIEPGQSRADIESWFRTLRDMRMPVCRIRLFKPHMTQGNREYDFSLYDWAFQAADKYGVKVCATLFPTEGLPAQGLKLPQSEQQLRDTAEYIRAVVEHFKSSPALDTWVLLNEPGVGFSDFPDGQYTMEKFKEWKARKPGVPATYGYRKLPLDWGMFQRAHTSWFMNWIADEIRKYDTPHQLHVNNHMIFELLVQYDFPQWMPFLTTLGASMHPAWHFRYLERDQYTLGVAAACDIIRGASEPKPFWVTELQGGNNTFSSFQPMCPTGDDITQWVWTSVGSGAQRVIFWTLNPRATGVEAGEWAMINFQGQPSERLMASSQVARAIEEHADFFGQASPVMSPITLLYSPESIIIQIRKEMRGVPDDYPGRRVGGHIKSVLAYYEAFQELGIPVQLKQMDHYDWKAESEFPRVAILANMLCLPSYQVEDLYTFVKNGNRLIVGGLTGFFDENEHCVYITGSPLEELLGGTISEYKLIDEFFEISLSDPTLTLPVHLWMGEIKNNSGQVIGKSGDQTIAVRNRYGEGEVLWVPSLVGLGSWQRDNTRLARLLNHETRSLTSELPFRFKRQYPGVIMKTLGSGNRYATILVNSSDDSETVELVMPEKKTPTVIVGGNLADKTVIPLKSQETVVVFWE